MIRNAAQLLTINDADLGIIEDGAVKVENGIITWVGRTAELRTEDRESQSIDASGCVVMPGFIDCHTHLVFGGYRDDEFEQRLKGRSYKEIAEEMRISLGSVESVMHRAKENLRKVMVKRLKKKSK